MEFLEKIEKLPKEVKFFFTSNECRFECEKSFFLYGLKSSELEKISKKIGMIFVGDEKLVNLLSFILKEISQNQGIANGLAYEINKRIFNKFPDYFQDSQFLLVQWEKNKSKPIISEEDAQAKLIELEPWIVEEQKEKIEKNKEQEENERKKINKFFSISILKAITIYPELGEQLVTSSPIKLKIFPTPVRPSIKNWIEDYRTVMGAQKHGMMERGNYLFHSENGKRLASGERKKIAEILRSLDEDVTLKIDPEKQEVIFEMAEEKNTVKNVPEASKSISSSPSHPSETFDNDFSSETKIERNFERAAGQNQASVPAQPTSTWKVLNPKNSVFKDSAEREPGANQVSNANFSFSSAHTFSGEKKVESEKPPIQQPVNGFRPNFEEKKYVPSINQKTTWYNSKAGKPWSEEEKSGPKVSGNVVDLRS